MISTYSLIGLCRRIGTSLRSGVDIRRMWEQERDRGTGRAKAAYGEILDQINAGDPVYEAMRDSGYFPDLVISMVEIGEHTGRSHEAFLKLAEHYDNQRKMQAAFLAGITWPALEFLAAVCVIGLLIYVFGLIGSATGTEPIDITGFGLVGARGVMIYFGTIGTAFATVALLIYAVLMGWLGAGPVLFAMQLPLIGPTLRYFALSRLTWALALSLDAGIDAMRSVRLAIDATQNPYFRSKIDRTLIAIRQGREFNEAFHEAGGFPEDFVTDLQTAELAGTLSESLVTMSRDYEESARTWMLRLTLTLTTVVRVGVMIVLIWLIFMLFKKVYLDPMNDLLREVGS